jgi:glycosyltransferase involved in cell wall biosynthesis
MRVALLTTFHETCGIASYSEALMAGLRATGVDVRVLAPKLAPGDVPRGSQPPRLWNRNRAFGFEAVRVFAAIRELGPDVVHAQVNPSLYSSRLLFTLALLLDRARIPMVATLHGRPGGALGRAFKMARLHLGLRHAHLIVHSEAHQRELARDGITVIPHGIERVHAIDRREARAALGLSATDTVVAHFGFLGPDKGVHEVLGAVAQLRARGHGDLHYWISGAVLNGSDESRRYFESLRRRAAELRITDHVHLTGEFVPHERALLELAASDWVVLAYQTGSHQGASGAARTALTSGSPAAVSRASIFDDIREATHTLAGPLDRALDQLLADRELRDRTAARARRFCEENSWENVAKRHAELYRDLTAPKRARSSA